MSRQLTGFPSGSNISKVFSVRREALDGTYDHT